MHRRSIALVSALLVLGVTMPAQQLPGYGAPIALADAQAVLAAARAAAVANQWQMAVAIVDPGGHLVAFERSDGTQFASVDIARDKARAAAAFRRPTKAFEDLVAGGGAGVRMLALPGVMPVEGGEPLIVDGAIVGAIGVSGGTSAQDGNVARAGASRLSGASSGVTSRPGAETQAAAAPWWKQGQPPEMRDSPLQPHTPAGTPTALADIPIDRLRVPQGFQVEVWAHGVLNARSLALGEKGTVFVGSRLAGNVYAIVDRGGRREVKTIASGLTRPNGVVVRNGALYVAEVSRLVRFDDIEARLDAPPPPVVVLDGLPNDEPHGWKSLALGPDRKIYFAIGAPCNICASPPPYAQIVRVDPDAAKPALEAVALGVRNTLGMDWHPESRELYFAENGHDWMGEDRPEDELNRAPKDGIHFGFPHCHQGTLPDPQLAAGRRCAEFTAPVMTLGVHVAPLGMRFYRGAQFPSAYRHDVFVALHGSWNRERKRGFAVMRIASPSSRTPRAEEFLSGFLQGETFWGRPVDVLELRDGSLLVSDDWNGAIYRVSYRGR